MDDGAEEDYGFEYEDEDGEDEADADGEHRYYNSKAFKEDDPDAAIRELKAVVELEPEKGEWRPTPPRSSSRASSPTRVTRIQGVIRECGGKMHMAESTSPVPNQFPFLSSSGNTHHFPIFFNQKTGPPPKETSFSTSPTTMKQARPNESKVLKYLVAAQMLIDGVRD
ncbi:hypothetical protein CF319_g8153 [Tilletia indica]|nr:hypothetical protein CF319_g8153 [Tilletia indica]